MNAKKDRFNFPRCTRKASKTIRFSDEEMKVLIPKVKSSGRTFSDFIRHAAISSEVTNVLDPETFLLLKRYSNGLTRIGVNINAIAERANTVGSDFGPGDLENAKSQAKALAALIREIRNKTI